MAEINNVGSYNFDVNPADAYLATNIEAATLKPSSTPEDLLGIRNDIYNELGIPKLQADYQNAYNAYLNTQTSQDSALNQLENKTLGMNVIRGAQAETSRQFSQKLGAQSRGMESLGMVLQAKLSEAGTQYGIRAQDIAFKKEMMLQYPGAGIRWGDSTEKIASRLEDYQEEMEKKAYKKELKNQLLALGKSVKGLSTNELERKLKKYNKSALERAEKVAKMEMEQLEISLAKAKKSLYEEPEQEAASFYGDNTTMGTSGLMSSSTPSFDFSFYGL